MVSSAARVEVVEADMRWVSQAAGRGRHGRRRPSRWRGWLAGGVAVIGLVAGTALGGETVLGMSAAFTGPSAGLGIELYRGARAHFEGLNEAGGIHGRRVVIRALDDGYAPDPAVRNTLRFLDDPDVLLLFSYLGTPTTTRILPLLKLREQLELQLFFAFTGAQPLRQPPYGRFAFNLRASYETETAGLVEHFARVGRRRVAVFHQADSYGRSGWNGVRGAVDRYDAVLVGEASYRRGGGFAQSYREQVEILRSSEPEVVISIGAYAACAGFIRDARDAGWSVPIANVSFVGSESLLALLLQAGREQGRDYTRGLVNSQVVPGYTDTSLPGVREYREAMSRHAGRLVPELADPGYVPLPYSFVSFEGFLNAKLLAELLQRLGPSPTRSQVAAAAEGLGDVDLGIGASAGFGADDHQGLERVYFTTVEGQGFVPVRDWEAFALR